jgi:hypothetical protein
VTRDQYIERARQLCNLVNVRRTQIAREPLRHQHIMRAVRLVLGTEPASRVPWGLRRYVPSGIEIDHAKVNAWEKTWLEKYSHRWKKTAKGLVPV